MLASVPVRWRCLLRGLNLVLVFGLMVLEAGWASRATAAVSDVYTTFGIFTGGNYSYGFGRFDLATPTGTSGSYSYAWTQLGATGSPTLANLAMNPVSGSMTLEYEFFQYRSITTAGVISGSLGPTSNFGGMAFDIAGDLHAYAPNDAPMTWLKLDAANGQTLTSGTIGGQVTGSELYSSFGGNMAAGPTGGYYFADESTDELVRLQLSGPNAITTISGSFAGGGFGPGVFSRLCMFTSGTTLYLLGDETLFTVNEATAALTRLGTITGVPTGITGFTGAASMITVVPEPASCGLAAVGLAASAGWWGLRRRNQKR